MYKGSSTLHYIPESRTNTFFLIILAYKVALTCETIWRHSKNTIAFMCVNISIFFIRTSSV